MSTSNSPDFAVVGGGIVGACVADELAAAGASVVVLDASPELGNATERAAGVAVPSLRYLADPFMYEWLTLARTGLLDDIDRLTPAHGTFSLSCPIVRLIDDTGAGVDEGRLGTVLGADAAEELAPGLRVPSEHRIFLSAGLMVDGAGYLAAVRTAARTAGAEWRQGVRVVDVADGTLSTQDGETIRAGQVVLACGAWTAQLCGGRLPVFPLRGQLAVLDVTRPPRCIVSSRYYLAPHPSGGLVVGATEEEAGFDDRCTVAGSVRLLGFAARTLPDLGSARVRVLRAGLRPATRTRRPLVGALPGTERTAVVCGHSGHGLLSARHTARGLAAALTRDEWDGIPLEFCPKRALETVG